MRHNKELLAFHNVLNYVVKHNASLIINSQRSAKIEPEIEGINAVNITTRRGDFMGNNRDSVPPLPRFACVSGGYGLY